MKTLKVGQDVTAVSKGIQHNMYGGKDWIDELQLGSTHFLKISRVGRVYLYGHYVRFEDGVRKETDWESDLKLEDWIILDGLRFDLARAYNDYRENINKYEAQRRDANNTIDSELYNLKCAKLGEWDKAHPRPQPMNLTNL